MLFADIVINTNESTLDQGERTLNRIGVDVPACIFLCAMTNAIMTRKLSANAPVGRVLIRVDSGGRVR